MEVYKRVEGICHCTYKVCSRQNPASRYNADTGEYQSNCKTLHEVIDGKSNCCGLRTWSSHMARSGDCRNAVPARLLVS
jgi:hypothetical protein